MARLGRSVIRIFVLLLLAVCLAFLFLPWKQWVVDAIRDGLQAQGFDATNLQIQSIGLDKITFDEIRLGDGGGLSLKNLSVGYSLADLAGGVIRDLILQDLVLEVRQDKGVWTVQGIKQGKGSFVMPVPQDIPVQSFLIENSQIRFVSDQWNMVLPVRAEWDKQKAEISLSAGVVPFEYGVMKVHAGSIKAGIIFKDGAWQGTWEILDILTPDYPVMQAKGTIEIKEQVLSVKGDMEAEGNTGHASFSIAYPFDNPEAMKVSITKGSMPWAGGHVSLGKTDIPADGKKNIRFLLDIQKISVDTLMELLTGQTVEATGTISGKIPLIIKPDGTITLEKGAMAANENGLISLPPGVIPGEGEQIDMTRQILENFEYDGLSVDVHEQEKGGIALLLALSGKNPKVYDGRIVKLNVRLGGDVLEFLQSNLTTFGNPKSLLDQEKK